MQRENRFSNTVVMCDTIIHVGARRAIAEA
jgi:hypothetical protein